MEREIKFKGKGVKTGDLEFGSYAKATDGKSFIVSVGKDDIGHIAYTREVEEGTVGQYIGITDENGVEIYEGNRVRFHGQVGRVVFEQGAFGIGFDEEIEWEKIEEERLDDTWGYDKMPACYNDHFISFWEIWNLDEEVEVVG